MKINRKWFDRWFLTYCWFIKEGVAADYNRTQWHNLLVKHLDKILMDEDGEEILKNFLHNLKGEDLYNENIEDFLGLIRRLVERYMKRQRVFEEEGHSPLKAHVFLENGCGNGTLICVFVMENLVWENNKKKEEQKMMEEIKYRAWFIPKTEKGNGNFMLYCAGIKNNVEGYRLIKEEINENILYPKEFWSNVLSYLGKVIIMLSTGLKDRNGKEIYEGDLVEYTESQEISEDGEILSEDITEGIVTFCDGYFYINSDYGFFPISKVVGDRNLKVIGNIYEGVEK